MDQNQGIVAALHFGEQLPAGQHLFSMPKDHFSESLFERIGIGD